MTGTNSGDDLQSKIAKLNGPFRGRIPTTGPGPDYARYLNLRDLKLTPDNEPVIRDGAVCFDSLDFEIKM